MKLGVQSYPRNLPQDTLANFAGEIGIDIRMVRTAFIRLMDSIETNLTQMIEVYMNRFGDLIILGDIVKVISYRIAKGRELVK